MKFREFFRSRLFFIFAAFIGLYVIFAIKFNQYNDLWWDAASYIGMAKYIFSNGKLGLFEPMKTILLPIFLGIGWKIGLNVIYFGKILAFLFSIASLAFVYLIGKELFDRKVGLIATIILFFNVLFFIFIFRIYTEMLSICFILGAIYFMIRFSNKPSPHYLRYLFLFLSALFSVLAFVNKYPNALIIGILELYLLYDFCKNKKLCYLIAFNVFLLPLVLPFLISNYLLFGDPLYLFNLSQEYFKSNLGHFYDLRTFPGIPRLLFENTDLIYFKSLLYLFNILLPFMFVGIWKIIKDKGERHYEKILLILLPAIVFFCFFEVFYLKQERYILSIFPMISLFIGYGLSKFNRKLVHPALFIYIIVSLIGSSLFFAISVGEMSYQEFFINPPINFSCASVSTSDSRAVMNYNITSTIYEVFDDKWNGGNILKDNPDCVFYYSRSSMIKEHVKIFEKMNYSVGYSRSNGVGLYAVFKKEEGKIVA